LRALFNNADEDGIISKQKCYPFGKRRYIIPSPRNVKKALSLADIGKVYYYKPTCKSEQKARDYWLFLYFGNGMNPFDMARLKYKNIDEEFIKDSLGHTTSKTTENYLDSFENEVKKDFAVKLVAFKKKPDNGRLSNKAIRDRSKAASPLKDDIV
jgi:hypothetical protein